MTLQIQTSEVTSAIGFFLTLTSLLGTYFYVHLSTWLRDILELNSKWDENADGDEEFRKRARIECKFQLKKLLNHIPILVSIIISAFIFGVFSFAVEMVESIPTRPLVIAYYSKAFNLFLSIYSTLTLYFLAHGYFLAFRMKKAMVPKQQQAK